MSDKLLPPNFKVYVQPETNTVLNHLEESFVEKTLPTFNHYLDSDGGYIAVYTREENAVYSVGDGINFAGIIRIKGSYIGRIFYPEGYYPGDDITNDQEILKICNKYFPNLIGKMWIGGDTGGWLGL